MKPFLSLLRTAGISLLFFLPAWPICTAFCPAGDSLAKSPPQWRTITDRNGNAVRVPAEAKRIACFYGPSYEKVFMLGAGDRVAVMSIQQPPWAKKLNPRLSQIPTMPSYDNLDIEKVINLGIDLVIYWQIPHQIEKISAVGIPVVSPYHPNPALRDPGDYVENYKKEILFYGDLLGGAATETAKEYCGYFAEKAWRVISRTGAIPLEARPKVHYVSGRTVFGTQGRNSLAHWLVEIAGGTLVSKDLPTHFVEASMEQIMAWNPEFVIISNFASPDPILKGKRWRAVRAVRENKVHIAPQGVFYWGHGSSEVVLFIQWLAKALHPHLFRDIDMIKEARTYYEKFYRYPLSDAEAERILNHLPPEGAEARPWLRKPGP